MFKEAILALLVVSASAGGSFDPSRRKGRALLKNAKVIEPSRHLEQNGYQYGNNGWDQYEYEADYELDLSGLSIKYLGCSEWMSVDADWQEEQQEQQMQYYYQQQQQQQEQQGGGDQQQQYQQGQYQQQQQYEAQQQYQNWQDYNDGLEKMSLVRFTLCADQTCGSCSGEFAVDMMQFVDAYTESKMDALDYQCEMIREHCYCQDGNWESCFQDCYSQAGFDLYGTDAGLEYCLTEYYGYEQFDLQVYLECQEMEQVDDEQQQYQQNQQNGGNYYQQNYDWQQEDVQYFVGLYCSSNQQIFLGAFYDEDCSYPAENAKFSSQNYGGSFPYFKTPIIQQNECILCQETESYYEMKAAYQQQQYYAQQANNQQYGGNGEADYNYYNWYEQDYGDANEVCGGSFEDAIKCDSSRGYYSGCNFIEETLPELDGRGSGSFIDSDVYEKLRRNKNSAIVMGVIAAILLGALAFMCGLCGGAGDPKKIALLEKRRMGEDEGQMT